MLHINMIKNMSKCYEPVIDANNHHHTISVTMLTFFILAMIQLMAK